MTFTVLSLAPSSSSLDTSAVPGKLLSPSSVAPLYSSSLLFPSPSSFAEPLLLEARDDELLLEALATELPLESSSLLEAALDDADVSSDESSSLRDCLIVRVYFTRRSNRAAVRSMESMRKPQGPTLQVFTVVGCF
jgi:hypothetical protein